MGLQEWNKRCFTVAELERGAWVLFYQVPVCLLLSALESYVHSLPTCSVTGEEHQGRAFRTFPVGSCWHKQTWRVPRGIFGTSHILPSM